MSRSMYSEFAPKKMIYGKDVHAKLLSGAREVHDAVGATMGHKGKLVMYENIAGIWPVVTKDGVSVADMIAFKDQAKNMGAQFVIQACNEQVRETGDGTTLTAILSYKFYETALRTNMSPEELQTRCDTAVEHVLAMSKKVKTLQELKNIARVSINHDNELGDAIATAVWEAGEYGMVAQERMFQEGYQIEKHEGYKLDTGLQQKEFANDGIRMVLDSPYVLATDKRIVDPQKLDNIIRQIHIKEGNTEERANKGILKPFSIAIIAPTIGLEIVKIMVKNMQHNNPVKIVHIKPSPDMQPMKNRFILEDIAAYTGADFISEESGIAIDRIDVAQLGRCEQIISFGKETFFKGKCEDTVAERMTLLKSYSDDVVKKSFAEESMAKLTGGMVVIKVGGKNFTDQNEISDRVDDCIRSCKSALQQGYVRGGGIELKDIADNIHWEDLAYPHQIICKNAEVETLDVDTKVIIDPTKVVVNAIKNATSVVRSMLRTQVMILAEPEPEGPKNPFDYLSSMSLN